MADVRALLREERLARRINHPYASYTTAGTLSCNVCNLRLQAESLWEPHLAGKVHRQNIQRVQSTAKSIPPSTKESNIQISGQHTNGVSRKRKADDEEDEEQQPPPTTGKKRKAVDGESDDETSRDSSLRKKAKASPRDTLPEGFFDGKTNDMAIVKQADQSLESVPKPKVVVPQQTPSHEIDDEYAAFEAAIAAAPAEEEAESTGPLNTFSASAAIVAAPVSAAEIAARDAEDSTRQRRDREEEIEGEKEDAARALEEEFDEMDQLEARVKKLREMRERLRTVSETKAIEDVSESTIQPAPDDVSEDDDDDDDLDDWGFR